MAIQVDPTHSPRIITIPETDGDSITIQSLVNQIRQWEDDQTNLSYAKLLSASGKEDLGSSTLVGITAKLENTKLKFEERSALTTCYVGGGNLVAVDLYGNSMFVIEPSINVTVALAQSSSATMVQLSEINTILSDIGTLKTDTTTIKIEVDKTQSDGIHDFEREKESLEAIRARIDEIYAKPSGARGFSI